MLPALPGTTQQELRESMSSKKEKLYIGIDVGSTTTKVVALDAETKQIRYSDYRRHHADQVSSVVNAVRELLERFGVTRTDRLVTAWDTFSKEHPGEAQRLEIAGQTVPDMIRELQKIGMYKG